MNKLLLLTLFFASFTLSSIAQEFDLSAELRSRYENRHGFKTLIDKNQDAANFISQRSRINFNFTNANLIFKISVQNVRTWGDVSTLNNDDTASSFHEAWAIAKLKNNISLKIGRQEIIYDDSRIFGNVNWVQQARSHDAFLIKYNPNANNRLDIGFALNANAQTVVHNPYNNIAGYKAMQYAWYHGKFNNIGLSLLALNTGFEYTNIIDNESQIDYMQTFGTRLTYKKGAFKADLSGYIQTGNLTEQSVSTSYIGANVSYNLNTSFTAGVGMELLSGKDSNDASNDIKSFNPIFGTNHKFNGWMDYFYVGNHGNNVGLTDVNCFISYKKNKFSAKVIPHLFMTAADLYEGSELLDSQLGSEIDIALGYKINSDISINGGFSIMFATDSMKYLKSKKDNDERNTVAYLMFTFKPHLFSTKKNNS